MATDSARTRRATNPTIWLEAASSHCASSTMTQQRPLLSHRGEQAQHGQSDQEPVGHFAGCESQSDAQGVALRGRESVEPVEHRPAELMDPSERQLHLRLNARELRDSVAGRLTGGVAQQRGLADAGLAADDQDLALASANPRQQPVEQFALAGPAHEARPTNDSPLEHA